MRLGSVKSAVGLPYRRLERMVTRHLLERGLPHETAPLVELTTFGFERSDHHRYEPSPWSILPRALRGERIGREHVFLELGCGKGRVVRQAARRPFGRVIGVDIAPDLIAMARENLAASTRLRAPAEYVEADATAYEIPDDVTHVYLFNPFGGDVLAAVVRNLVASLDRRPRELTVLYAAPEYAHVLEATGRFRTVRESRGLRRDLLASHIKVLKSVPAGA